RDSRQQLRQLDPRPVQIRRDDVVRAGRARDAPADLAMSPSEIADVPAREKVDVLSAARVVQKTAGGARDLNVLRLRRARQEPLVGLLEIHEVSQPAINWPTSPSRPLNPWSVSSSTTIS